MLRIRGREGERWYDREVGGGGGVRIIRFLVFGGGGNWDGHGLGKLVSA